MNTRPPRWVRPLVGMAVLVALGLRFGTEPFIDGLRRVDGRGLLVALGITAWTTWCCARRWSLLAGRLDVPVSLPAAYLACHRAQFLNAVLPGGVAGDVHRAFRHGREAGALGRALRSVVWDRVTGQLVQVAAAVAVLALLPATVQRAGGWLLGAAAAATTVVGASLSRRRLRALVAEIRQVPGARGVASRVVLLSLAATGGHVAVFVIAARAAGVTGPLTELVPLGLVVLVAAAVPLGFAGWGPREGAAAWVFAAAGLGGATGVEVTVTYGVMSLVATLPGALVVLSRRGRPALEPDHEEVTHA